MIYNTRDLVSAFCEEPVVGEAVVTSVLVLDPLAGTLGAVFSLDTRLIFLLSRAL